MGLKKQIKEFIKYELELDAHSQEVEELKNEIENSGDFYIKIDGQEYRFISRLKVLFRSEFKIWDIYLEHHFEGELYYIFRIN